MQDVTSVDALSDAGLDAIINQVFATKNEAHPAVVAFKSASDTLIAGPIQVLNFSYFPNDFPEIFRGDHTVLYKCCSQV